jgi:hypothetical protein
MVEHPGDGSTAYSYLVAFREPDGKSESVLVPSRRWKSTQKGDPFVVYRKDGGKVRYAHMSRPMATASLPTRVLLFVSMLVSGILTLLVPVLVAMALTGEICAPPV